MRLKLLEPVNQPISAYKLIRAYRLIHFEHIKGGNAISDTHGMKHAKE